MFNFFKRKKQNVDAFVVDALVNQSIGGQSVLFRFFRDALGCNPAEFRLLELTYFMATIISFVYLRVGTQENREQVLDAFARKILEQSIPSSREDISLSDAIKEYQSRFVEYNAVLPLLFNPAQSSSGNPTATLLMMAFERITQSSAKGHMIKITAATRFTQDFVADNIDFVRNKL